MNKIKKKIPKFSFHLEKGNFKHMIRWLKENVHEKGNFYKINEILEKITGEKLNLNHYENHISDRYIKEIY